MSKKTKRVKGRTVDIAEFLNEAGNIPKPGFAIVQNKSDWSDDAHGTDIGPIVLPTAPIASRGGLVDESKVPLDPPYVAFLGNLPFEIIEDDVSGFFKDLKLTNVRLARDSSERFRGFGYAEFSDRQSLIGALALDGEEMRNRGVKVGLPNDNEGDSRYGRDRNQGGGFGSRGERMPERDLPSDWRASAREEHSTRSSETYNTPDRYGGGGFSNRGGFGDRGGSESRQWRDHGSESRGFSRYEPTRDRSEPSSAPTERRKLTLAKRTVPQKEIVVIEEPEPEPKPEPPKPKIKKPKAEDIFGAAKPVDTATKQAEIEKRLEEKRKAELKKLEEEAQNSKRSDESPQRNQNKQPQNGEKKSWRAEIREEKDKKDRKPRSERRAPAAQVENKPFVVNSKNKFAELEVNDNNHESGKEAEIEEKQED